MSQKTLDSKILIIAPFFTPALNNCDGYNAFLYYIINELRTTKGTPELHIATQNKLFNIDQSVIIHDEFISTENIKNIIIKFNIDSIFIILGDEHSENILLSLEGFLKSRKINVLCHNNLHNVIIKHRAELKKIKSQSVLKRIFNEKDVKIKNMASALKGIIFPIKLYFNNEAIYVNTKEDYLTFVSEHKQFENELVAVKPNLINYRLYQIVATADKFGNKSILGIIEAESNEDLSPNVYGIPFRLKQKEFLKIRDRIYNIIDNIGLHSYLCTFTVIYNDIGNFIISDIKIGICKDINTISSIKLVNLYNISAKLLTSEDKIAEIANYNTLPVSELSSLYNMQLSEIKEKNTHKVNIVYNKENNKNQFILSNKNKIYSDCIDIKNTNFDLKTIIMIDFNSLNDHAAVDYINGLRYSGKFNIISIGQNIASLTYWLSNYIFCTNLDFKTLKDIIQILDKKLEFNDAKIKFLSYDRELNDYIKNDKYLSNKIELLQDLNDSDFHSTKTQIELNKKYIYILNKDIPDKNKGHKFHIFAISDNQNVIFSDTINELHQDRYIATKSLSSPYFEDQVNQLKNLLSKNIKLNGIICISFFYKDGNIYISDISSQKCISSLGSFFENINIFGLFENVAKLSVNKLKLNELTTSYIDHFTGFSSFPVYDNIYIKKQNHEPLNLIGNIVQHDATIFSSIEKQFIATNHLVGNKNTNIIISGTLNDSKYILNIIKDILDINNEYKIYVTQQLYSELYGKVKVENLTTISKKIITNTLVIFNISCDTILAENAIRNKIPTTYDIESSQLFIKILSTYFK